MLIIDPFSGYVLKNRGFINPNLQNLTINRDITLKPRSHEPIVAQLRFKIRPMLNKCFHNSG